MSRRIRRRSVMGGLAATALGWQFVPSASAVYSYQANEKVRFVAIGLGNRGSYLAPTFARIGGLPVALCDANESRLDALSQKLPQAERCNDFRKLFDEKANQFDAVVVATPDHVHAVASAAAMHLGKHVYCEKPIAHDVREARHLRALALEKGVATQMGNQGMATDSFRRVLELLEDGIIGAIREVHVWFVFGGPGPRTPPREQPPIPPGLNWDLWLGPAAERPYHPLYTQEWGAWWDFGTGILGGGGSHSLNLAFKALNLRSLWDGPSHADKNIRVESVVPAKAPHAFPRWQFVTFHIPARAEQPPARIHWYNASQEELVRQGIWQKLTDIAGRDLVWKDGSWTPESGTLLVGEKGIVHTNAHNSVCHILPLDKFPEQKSPPQRYSHVAGHEYEWLHACQGKGRGFSNFDHAGPVIELLLVANVSGRFDEPLEYDPVEGRITNNAEADGLLRPPYRSGWSL